MDELFMSWKADIISKVLNSDDISNKKDTFIWFLEGLKDNYRLSVLVDNHFLYMSIHMLNYLDKDYERIKAINAILSCMCNIEYDYNSNIDVILKLYNMTLDCIDNGCESETDILEIFSSLSDMGIGYDIILKECVKRLNDKFCICIFSNLNVDWKKYHLEEYTYMIDLIEVNRKIRKRFDLILRFFSMVDVHYVNKADIINSYLAHPYNYTGLWADWIFFSNQESSYYDDVISEEEKEIFVKIGDIFNGIKTQTHVLKVQDEDIDEEFDNLWECYEEAGMEFQLILNSERVRKLVEQFTQGRSFWDIALCLPK